jgi:hypothetical protein
LQPHGYPDWGNPNTTAVKTPFSHDKSEWGVEEPVLIGEFWEQVFDGKDLTPELWYGLKERGYAGGLAGWLAGWLA